MSVGRGSTDGKFMRGDVVALVVPDKQIFSCSRRTRVSDQEMDNFLSDHDRVSILQRMMDAGGRGKGEGANCFS